MSPMNFLTQRNTFLHVVTPQEAEAKERALWRSRSAPARLLDRDASPQQGLRPCRPGLVAPGPAVAGAVQAAGKQRAGPQKAKAAGKPEASKTTLMLRNLPKHFDRNALAALLDSHGLAGKYDFLYMPIHFLNQTSFGYAFVNMVNSKEAKQLRSCLEGAILDKGEDPVEVDWSAMLQGLKENVNRFRNSRVMHKGVPDTAKPAIFCNGRRAAFPPPTKRVGCPRPRVAKTLSE